MPFRKFEIGFDPNPLLVSRLVKVFEPESELINYRFETADKDGIGDIVDFISPYALEKAIEGNKKIDDYIEELDKQVRDGIISSNEYNDKLLNFIQKVHTSHRRVWIPIQLTPLEIIQSRLT